MSDCEVHDCADGSKAGSKRAHSLRTLVFRFSQASIPVYTDVTEVTVVEGAGVAIVAGGIALVKADQGTLRMSSRRRCRDWVSESWTAIETMRPDVVGLVDEELSHGE